MIVPVKVEHELRRKPKPINKPSNANPRRQRQCFTPFLRDRFCGEELAPKRDNRKRFGFWTAMALRQPVNFGGGTQAQFF